jgi:hypothetical protein
VISVGSGLVRGETFLVTIPELFDRELFLGNMVSLLRRSRVGHRDQEGRQKCFNDPVWTQKNQTA